MKKFKIMYYENFSGYKYVIVFKRFLFWYRLIQYKEDVKIAGLDYSVNKTFIKDFSEITFYEKHKYVPLSEFISRSLPANFHYEIDKGNVEEIYLDSLDELFEKYPEKFI